MSSGERPLGDLLTWGHTSLKEAGLTNARHEARLLLSLASGLTRESIIAHAERPLSHGVERAYRDLIHRRVQERIPLSRLAGSREFWSLPFILSPETLDPRPDSETLVEAVLTALKQQKREHSPLRILDLGTGSGCLLIALLTELPNATGVGVDQSEEALETAQKNARLNEVDARTTFLRGYWADEVTETYDVVISNPPYIPADDLGALEPEVKDHDPYRALTPGPEGLEAYRYLAPQLSRLLTPTGLCALEFGAGQHQDVQDILWTSNLSLVSWHRDLAGHLRCGLFELSEKDSSQS